MTLAGMIYASMTALGAAAKNNVPEGWSEVIAEKDWATVNAVLETVVANVSPTNPGLLLYLLRSIEPYSDQITSYEAFSEYVGWRIYNSSGTDLSSREVSTHLVPGQATPLKIMVVDEPSAVANACNRYDIIGFDTGGNPSHSTVLGPEVVMNYLPIIFQNGNPAEVGQNGITIEALLAVAAHRLEGYRSGRFACDDNQEALDHIQKALDALQRRTRARLERHVEGTHKP